MITTPRVSLVSIAACTIVVILLALTTPSAQQREHNDVPRDQWQRVADIFRELGVGPGKRIADIGAGSGYFTTRLANAVGPTGMVYAVDVNPISLRELKDALGTDTTNVTIVRGDENNPHLPAGQVDGVLIVNAYHEFAEYPEMLRHIRGALAPGGRLVLIEPIPRGAGGTTRAEQTKRHSIAIELVEADLMQAGFEVVLKDARFVTRPDHQADGAPAPAALTPTDWLLVARRPAGSPPSGR